MDKFPEMTAINRQAIRTAIRNHPGLAAFSAQYPGRKLSDWNKAQLCAACVALGIDANAVVQAHSAQTIAGIIAASVAPASVPASVASPAIDNENQTENQNENESANTMQIDVTTIEIETPRTAIDLASDILAPFQAFAAPSLLAKSQASLDALVKLALSKPKTKAPSLPGQYATPAGKVSISKAFGIRGRSAWHTMPVTVWRDAPNEFTQEVDNEFIFEAQTLGLILSATERNEGVWLYGPMGTGKTEITQQIAARLGRPYFRIPFGDGMDRYSLVGQDMPHITKGSEWRDGILTKAIRTPGAFIALDEITTSKPELLTLLQTCQDVRALSIEATGELVPFAEGVSFIALDNTSGFGDDTGRYLGTGAMNTAFLNRFPRKIEVARHPVSLLADVIRARTGLPIAPALTLANVLRASETFCDSGKLSTHLSLRNVISFGRDLVAGLPVEDCLHTTLTSALPAAEKEAFRSHVLLNLDLQKLATEAQSATQTTPAPMTATPSAKAIAAADEFSIADLQS